MKPTFTKKYKILTPSAVAAVAEKYKFLKLNLPDHTNLIVPEVITTNKEDSITFTKLPIEEMVSLRQHMKEASFNEVVKTFYKVGESLAILHKVLQKKKYVHGDLWPENIFLYKDSIVFFDFEPISKKSWQKSIYNNVEYDLANFIKISETLFPHQAFLTYPLNRSRWYSSLLNGYQVNGGIYNEQELKKQVKNGFISDCRGLVKDTKRSVANRAGALVFRCLTWLCNPMLR